MTDRIIFARVSTRKKIVEDNWKFARLELEMNGYYYSDDVDMRIAQEEGDLISSGWHKSHVDGLGIIYIDRWVWRRKQAV